jgi:hypothetical protein
MLFANLISGEKAATLPGILKPQRIYVHKNRLYIVERITVSIFSSDNFNLINKTGKEGEGPGEFKEEIFNLYFRDGQVLANSAGRVTYFSEDGAYIKEEKSSAPGTGAYLPAIRFFFFSGNKIYVQTYKKENNKSEFFVFDKTGNLLKKVFVPFIEEEFSYNEFSVPRFHTIAEGKLYQLLENDDEEWDLHITDIK